MKYMLITCLLFPFSCFAQCDYLVNGFDKFEEIEKVVTQKQRIWALPKQGAFECSFARIGTSYFLTAGVPLSDVGAVRAGGESIFLFTNGEKLSLSSIGTEVANYKILAKMAFWELPIRFELTEAQLELFASMQLSDVRFYTSDTYRTYTIKKEKNANKVLQMASCVTK